MAEFANIVDGEILSIEKLPNSIRSNGGALITNVSLLTDAELNALCWYRVERPEATESWQKIEDVPTFDGQVLRFNIINRNLQAYKDELRQTIDKKVDDFRRALIPSGLLITIEYQHAYESAKAYLGELEESDEVAVPSYVADTAIDLDMPDLQAAKYIVQKYDEYQQIIAESRSVRIRNDAKISKAKDHTEAKAAFEAASLAVSGLYDAYTN